MHQIFHLADLKAIDNKVDHRLIRSGIISLRINCRNTVFECF